MREYNRFVNANAVQLETNRGLVTDDSEERIVTEKLVDCDEFIVEE